MWLRQTAAAPSTQKLEKLRHRPCRSTEELNAGFELPDLLAITKQGGLSQNNTVGVTTDVCGQNMYLTAKGSVWLSKCAVIYLQTHSWVCMGAILMQKHSYKTDINAIYLQLSKGRIHYFMTE